MKTIMTPISLGAILATGFVCAAQAADESNPGLTELVQILRNEGVLDDAQYEHIAAKASQREEQKSWFDKITLSGDLRGRYEGYFYNKDATGNERKDRNRWRYRLRIKAEAEINDHVNAVFRIVSGDRDDRSTNQTLGSNLDFDSDTLEIDQAYLQITPWANGEIPGAEGYLGIEFGKMVNPFVWKHGKDFLLWDHDISPEGFQLKVRGDAADNLELFANTAYYILEENSSDRDPQILGLQGGAHWGITEKLDLGSRLSWFHFSDLNDEFFDRATDDSLADESATDGGGNLGRALSGGDGILDVIETTGYLTARWWDGWPVTLYWTYSNNLAADDSAGAGEEDDAWMLGAEIGSKEEWVKLGFLYAEIEANAFPSMLIDSDLFDGRTNRKGWAFYGSRQIWTNTDFSFTAFLSDEIHGSIPPYDHSAPDADRLRIIADVKVKF